ncbi:hypothetical protein [Micromonospora sp. S-DT3-3-22]|uniref:hypothetical protein n=1 Tax=Micromonospora sp. S-DT3-3-22 TaxID=2755359 RepID=UPI00188DE413|nr:hypothetical protein [Micromonospora sp. S-DT3-3-22]
MSIFHRKGKSAQPPAYDPAIGKAAYGQAKPVNHPGANYPTAHRTQDATLAGIGRRDATKRKR